MSLIGTRVHRLFVPRSVRPLDVSTPVMDMSVPLARVSRWGVSYWGDPIEKARAKRANIHTRSPGSVAVLFPKMGVETSRGCTYIPNLHGRKVCTPTESFLHELYRHRYTQGHGVGRYSQGSHCFRHPLAAKCMVFKIVDILGGAELDLSDMMTACRSPI